jgi:dynein heavy chain
VLEEKMGEYNENVASMDLVLFSIACEHIARIARIIDQPCGNALLVGVGGSGKQSLTKLSAHISKHEQFPIQLSKAYQLSNMLEDIKGLYEMAGPMGKSVTFLMTDSEIKNESFLEAINSMLATGEIPGLI